MKKVTEALLAKQQDLDVANSERATLLLKLEMSKRKENIMEIQSETQQHHNLIPDDQSQVSLRKGGFQFLKSIGKKSLSVVMPRRFLEVANKLDFVWVWAISRFRRFVCLFVRFFFF